MKILMKVLRGLLWTLAVIVVLLVLAVATSPLWLGPVAKSVANSVAPKYTGTPFHIAELSINPFSGKLRVEECHLANPEGYSAKEAFSVSTVTVQIAMGSLFTKRIEIKSIVIRGLYASYISKDGTNNFDVIAENATHAEAEKAARERGMTDEQKKTYEDGLAKAADAEKAKQKAADAIAATNGTATRVVIDLVDLADSHITTDALLVGMTLPLPSLTLHDIGKDDPDGTTFVGAVKAVWAGILKGITAAGGGISTAAGAVGKGAGKAADAVSKGASSVIKGVEGLFGGDDKKK